MGWTKVVKVSLRLFKEIGQDDISGAAAELAYKLFLAMFPFLIFLAALGAFVSDIFDVTNPTDEITRLIGSSLPPDAAELLREQVDTVVGSKNGALLSVGIVGAIWAASSGIGTLIKGMNRIFEVKETRSLPKRYGIAVGLTVLAGGFLVAALVLLLAGQIYGERIAGEIGLEGQSILFFTWARWPIAVLLLLTAMAFLFWAAPNVDLPFRWISPGALLFVVVWLPATSLFGLYVADFGSYGDTYGALGGVVVLLVWLYLTSFILLLGVELNAVLAQESAPRELEQRAGSGVTRRTAVGGQGEAESEEGELEAERPTVPAGMLWPYRALMAVFLLGAVIWGVIVRRLRPA